MKKPEDTLERGDTCGFFIFEMTFSDNHQFSLVNCQHD